MGASEAFLALVKRFARPGASEPKAKTVNLLGLTPLDFYVGGTVKALHSALEQQGWNILASIAMDTDLEKIRDSVDAQINLVVSQSGLAMAEYYKDMYNIPYVVGPLCRE
ncbi:MAG: nitrogenase component 1 [Clostridia bacterium]